jgi:hypothetical protein
VMMADITMCVDHKCPMKATCYRYMAKPDEYAQSYGQFNRRASDQKCRHFWDVKRV